MLNLLKTIAVQDQTVTSNIATLDNIMSGVDGSATIGYNLEAMSLQVNDNQKQHPNQLFHQSLPFSNSLRSFSKSL
jgi:hypothetical protein